MRGTDAFFLELTQFYIRSTGLMWVLYAAAGAHIGYSHDPIQTSNFALIIIGIGTVLWSFQWWSLNIVAGWIIWLICGPFNHPEVAWGHYSFMLAFATVLSCFAQIVLSKHRISLALIQHQLEQRPTRLEKLEAARETMLAMEVHDLRNPLTIVMSNLDLAKSVWFTLPRG